MMIKSINAHEAKHWLDNNEAIIVDVREPAEYAEAHIPGASLVPVGTIEIDKLPPHDNKKVIIHCKFGKRGSVACEKLIGSGANLEVYNLEGGITAWIEAGYPVK